MQNEKNRYSIQGFKLLAAAVVKQAAKDKAESFFKSEQFKMFMPEYDGTTMWNQIQENYSKTGKWCADKKYEDVD